MGLAVLENAVQILLHYVNTLVSLVLHFHIAYHNDLPRAVVHAETLHTNDQVLLSLGTQCIRANSSIPTGCKIKP